MVWEFILSQPLPTKKCPMDRLRCEKYFYTLIMFYTGMRINEMLSLIKFNIDLKNQTITVSLKTDAGNI
ncbi:MAG: tyrosine-type recombinase/integrase [Dehalobacterium sp.]